VSLLVRLVVFALVVSAYANQGPSNSGQRFRRRVREYGKRRHARQHSTDGVRVLTIPASTMT
jgi:hypothetical protein